MILEYFVYVCMTKNHFFTYQMVKRVASWLMIWMLSALALQAQRLTFTNAVVDHGVSVWKKPVTVSFSFTNTSDKPLTVERVEVPCGCLTPHWTMVPVKPQATGEVRVTFDAMQLGRYDKMIDVFVSGQTKPIQVRMRGKVVAQPPDAYAEQGDEGSADVGDDFAVFAVQPRIQCQPAELVLAYAGANKKKATLVIQNTGRGVLRIHEISSAHPAISIKPPKTSLVAGERVKVKVTYNRQMFVSGDFEPDITIRSNDPLQPKVIVPVK